MESSKSLMNYSFTFVIVKHNISYNSEASIHSNITYINNHYIAYAGLDSLPPIAGTEEYLATF